MFTVPIRLDQRQTSEWAMSANLRPLELEDVIELLRSEVERAGSQSAFAKKAGVDRATVNRVLRGRLAPTQKLIDGLNLRIVYLPK
jgi:transcriptional regulator GlxA family with amidase domain